MNSIYPWIYKDIIGTAYPHEGRGHAEAYLLSLTVCVTQYQPSGQLTYKESTANPRTRTSRHNDGRYPSKRVLDEPLDSTMTKHDSLVG